MPESPVSQHKIFLECIAGKDERKRVVITENAIKIGASSLHPDLAIDELNESQGYILIWLSNGILVVDAGHCTVPLYINNREIKKDPIYEQNVLRIGNSVWRARYNTFKLSDGLKGRFSDLIGLEELKDFRLGEIFSSVLKKHTTEEMEDQLITGTPRSLTA